MAEKLTGWKKSEAANKPLSEIFQLLDESTRKSISDPVELCLREGRMIALSNHTLLVNKNGSEIPIEDSAAPIKNNKGNITGAVLAFHDVEQSRELKKQLEWQASHDPLTELYNRREFEMRLNDFISTNLTENLRSYCLMYLDLDQFKIVNDTCGHSAGDRLLKEISPLLQQQLSEKDTLARLGGDEFGILLPDAGENDAIAMAKNILKSINTYRFYANQKLFEIGASIGIVRSNGSSSDMSTVLSNADMACYAAKDLGRNRFYLFEENDRDLLKKQREMEWVSRINQAFEQNRFHLFAQKIISVNSSGSASHYEILLRIKEQENKYISPGAFLPSAERYNLIQDIDRWVIDRAFHFITSANNGKKKNSIFSINLSGMSVSDENLQKFIEDRLLYYKISPEQICFEITETAAISNLGRVHKLMLELKSRGIKFALDDFGSGLSSFAYLKHLPVDYLKIDGNFVSEILNNPVDRAMVESINQIGHVMNLKTIAEFVVSDSILSELKLIGVDYAQGYAIDRPVPIEKI